MVLQPKKLAWFSNILQVRFTVHWAHRWWLTNCIVEGVGATTTTVKTLPSAVIGTFGPDLYKILSRFIPFLPQVGSRGTKRKLIDDFTGVLRDGQMMLVLGRPGSGCSTFLKSISNKRNGFAAVTGEVSYGGISAEEQLKHYRGEVIYNEEDDQHFASMTVEQTLDFALLNKTKKHHKGSIPIIINALLNSKYWTPQLYHMMNILATIVTKYYSEHL